MWFLNLKGIIPRSIEGIFKQLNAIGTEYIVNVSHLEIYNEELTDLLSDLDIPKKLTIYSDNNNSRKGSVFVKGLEEVCVKSSQDIFDVLAKRFTLC